MRYGFLFGGVALVLGVGPYVLALPVPLQLASLVAATGFVSPALAYFSDRPAFFGKTAQGRIPGWSWVINGPMLVVGGVGLSIVKMSSEPAFTEVLPGLFIGGQLTTTEAKRLIGLGVEVVVDLTAELPETAALAELRYLNIPVLDANAPTLAEFEEGLAWMGDGQGVYVHCALGHGRSATLMVSYLLRHGIATSVDSAEAFLQERRPAIRLHRAQRARLEQWLRRAIPQD